jgi:hypothetical protein
VLAGVLLLVTVGRGSVGADRDFPGVYAEIAPVVTTLRAQIHQVR